LNSEDRLTHRLVFNHKYRGMIAQNNFANHSFIGMKDKVFDNQSLWQGNNGVKRKLQPSQTGTRADSPRIAQF
jgi:hypothetical protein